MPEFLAEVYVSDGSSAFTLPRTDAVHQAAAEVASDGVPVQLIRQIHVPVEETCFYLFEAPSKDMVLDVASRCGLRFDRVVGAVSGPYTPMPSWSPRVNPTVRVSSIQEES